MFRQTLQAVILFITAGSLTGETLGTGTTYLLRDFKPTAVAVGDITGDGIDDIVAGEFLCDDNCRLAVLVGGPDGLAPARMYESGAATAITTGDFNGDSLTDVAISLENFECGFIVHLQQPDHSLGPAIRYEPPRCSYDIDSADVTGDGLTDIIVMPWGSSTDDMYVYEQTAGGLLVRHDFTMWGGGYDDLDVADLTGDGLPDAVSVSTQAQPKIGVRPGVPGSIFGPLLLVDSPWPDRPVEVEIGDLNGDSLPDLAVVTSDRGIGILYQTSGGEFTTGPLLTTYAWPNSMLVQDLDGDGLADIVVMAPYNPTIGRNVVQMWFQEPGGTFRYEEAVLPLIGSNDHLHDHLAIGDINGDGSLDLVVARDGGALVVYQSASIAPLDVPTLSTALLLAFAAVVSVLGYVTLRT